MNFRNLLDMFLTAVIIIMILSYLFIDSAKAVSPKRYLYCENKDLQSQRLEIAIDKEYKQDNPNMARIQNMNKNLNRVNMILDRNCAGCGFGGIEAIQQMLVFPDVVRVD